LPAHYLIRGGFGIWFVKAFLFSLKAETPSGAPLHLDLFCGKIGSGKIV
jgi:hypothetical protein